MYPLPTTFGLVIFIVISSILETVGKQQSLPLSLPALINRWSSEQAGIAYQLQGLDSKPRLPAGTHLCCSVTKSLVAILTISESSPLLTSCRPAQPLPLKGLLVTAITRSTAQWEGVQKCACKRDLPKVKSLSPLAAR
jgi:hypothetical protein